MAAALLVIVAAGALFLSMAPLPGNRSSLGVLPFVALDGDPASVYLANGLYEDLTAELGRVGGLTVIGKTSAARLRQQGVDAAEVGRQLRVPAVLDGSVRRDDGHVRITARLVESGTGRQLWAESFDCPWRAILDIQRDVATAVAVALARDRGPVSAPAVSRVTDDPDAWDAYLQARYMRDRHNQEGLEASVPLFERAVALDPSYAAAWTGLGEALTMLAFHGLTPKDAAIPRARLALDRAIALEPQSAEAHSARAWLALVHDWQWAEAERGFRRALAIAPGLARARQCYAFGLASRRRFDEALAQSRQAMALDPHSYAASNDLSVLLLFARRYDEAIAQARDTLSLDPSLSIAHVNIGSALLGKGSPAEALREFDRGIDTARFSTVLGRTGYAYAMLGREHDARTMLRANPRDLRRPGCVSDGTRVRLRGRRRSPRHPRGDRTGGGLARRRGDLHRRAAVLRQPPRGPRLRVLAGPRWAHQALTPGRTRVSALQVRAATWPASAPRRPTRRMPSARARRAANDRAGRRSGHSRVGPTGRAGARTVTVRSPRDR